MAGLPQSTGIKPALFAKDRRRYPRCGWNHASGGHIGAQRRLGSHGRSADPDTFATLVQMSRDIYPHEKLRDEVYSGAVSARRCRERRCRVQGDARKRCRGSRQGGGQRLPKAGERGEAGRDSREHRRRRVLPEGDLTMKGVKTVILEAGGRHETR